MAYNLEDLTEELQVIFIKGYTEELTSLLSNKTVEEISFNHVYEDVHRYSLDMLISRCGYKSCFTRYNHARGRSTFQLRKQFVHPEQERRQLEAGCSVPDHVQL